MIERFFRALGFGDLGYRLTRWWRIHWPLIGAVGLAAYVATIFVSLSLGLVWSPLTIVAGVMVVGPMVLCLAAVVLGVPAFLCAALISEAYAWVKRRKAAEEEIR